MKKITQKAVMSNLFQRLQENKGLRSVSTMMIVCVLSLCWMNISAQNITSPDGLTKVEFTLSDGIPYYCVRYAETQIVEKSPLGLQTNVGDFSKDLIFTGQKNSSIDKTYTQNKIKRSKVRYQANEAVLTCENPQKRRFDIIFRVSDNNVAFRYALPQTDETARCIVERETTAFRFPDFTTTFLTPQATPMTGWKRTKPSYEEEYKADAPLVSKSKYGIGYTFPALFHVGANAWALISETGVNSAYCASKLSEVSENGTYTIDFPEQGENNGIGNASPALALPGTTPWRTITVGNSLKPIVETTIAFDVVEPLYEPSREYKFGRGTWSWIIWQDESMNFADQITFVDLAANLGYEFILIDALWDKNLGYKKMEELLQYANSKGVAPFVWYNSNGFWSDAPQGPKQRMNSSVARKAEMRWLKSQGVKGLKVDFFGGDKQETMKLYEDILTDANEYGLLIIFHGCTLPRGWERMYPNYVSSEAILASENLIFNQRSSDNEAFNASLHPFIRNTAGSMEFGPVLLNKRYNRTNNGGSTRRTGDIFQLATAVLFQSAVQMFAITPNNLTDCQPFVIDFMKKVPTTWDETIFLDGYPGRFVALARRHGDKWYIAAINAEKETKKLTLKLDFLNAKNLVKYADKKSLLPAMENVKLQKNNEITIEIEPQGGIVLIN